MSAGALAYAPAYELDNEYEHDTEVVDLDDFNPAKDLTLQVRTDGSRWHRRAIGGLTTACGDPIERGWDFELRHESYRGELCAAGCFSKYELEQSAALNAEPIELPKAKAFVRRTNK